MKGALIGLAPALPANIRLGWKGMPAVAYYDNSKIMGVKSFIVQAPDYVH
jgi:hypothetical protein